MFFFFLITEIEICTLIVSVYLHLTRENCFHGSSNLNRFFFLRDFLRIIFA